MSYRLIGVTGPRKLNSNKVVKESDGSRIHSRGHRLKLGVQHFVEQFR